MDKSWYKVYECNTTDKFDFDSDKELFASDCLAKSHSFAYNKWLASNKTKVYTIIQPYDGSCRGGYGLADEEEIKMKTKYFIFKLEWSQTDEEMVIVKAESREKAEAYLKRNKDLGPRYVTYYGQQDKVIEL